MNNIKKAIEKILIANNIPFKELIHQPVFNSADVSSLLNTNLAFESKSLVLDLKSEVGIFTIPINSRLNMSKLGKQIRAKKISFLSAHKVESLLNVKPGAIAPFGYNNKIKCYISSLFLQNNLFYFHPGVNTQTFVIQTDSLLTLEKQGVIVFIDHALITH